MRKLLLLLILSLFSAQGLAAACPDGSEPTRTVSADGGYYVYNCGNTNNEQTSSSVDISVSVDTEEALESQTLDSKRFESSIQKNGKVIFEGADQFTKFDFGIPLDNSGALLVGFKDLTWLSDKKVNVRTHIRYGNIDFSVGICFEYYSPQDFMAARTSFKKNDWGGLKNIMPSSRCIGTWELDDNKSKLEELGVYAVMDDIQLEQNTRKLLEALDEQTNGSLCFLLAKIISKENCVNITETEAVDTEEAIEKELAEFEAELEAELSEAGTSKLKVIPAKAKKTTDGVLKCKYGFYQNNNDQFSCSKLPANAVAYGSGPGFFCRTGYEKKYEIVCVKSSEPNNKADDIIVNYDAIEKELAEFEAELEAELSEAGASKLKVIPANAHASGSSFMCNNGYYKNSSTTGCLKVPVNAKKYASDKGWSCNTGYTKTGKSCENTAELEKKKLEQEKFEEEKRVAEEKIAKKRKEAQTLAQTYFNDLVAFLKTNNKEYDITTIVSLVTSNKAILTESWNEVLEKNFAKLKVYTDSSEAFLDYHKSKNDERQKVILNELARANTKLKNIITYLKFYVQNNITSDIAPAVLDQIKIAEGTYEVQKLNEVSKVSTQVEQFISKNNLLKDYLAFVKSLSQSKQEKPDPVVIPDNAHASGSSWACNTGYTKTGNSCENTAEIVKKRKEAQTLAQTYFNDLVAFLKTNNKEYDITTIVSLVTSNKAILTESWNEVLEKNFAKLKVYTDSSEAFLDYHKSKNDERQKVILNELARANTKLKNIITYLKFYVQNNITSDIAQSVLDQIKVAEKGLKMQNSKELSKVSTQLESFITKNNLSTDYRTFVKSLSKTKTKTETPQVTTNNIDATYLVNVDFIKKANKSDYIALVNLTGKAPNALLNLEGRVVFENDNALSCFYQSKNTIKNDLKYYLYDKFSNNEFLVLDKGFECNQNNLFSYDLVFFEKDTLLRESKSYVSSLAAAIAYNQLQLFNTVTKEEQNKDFADRKNKVRNITEGLEDEMILGFGSLIIDNDNTTLCTDVENTLGQASIMNLWLPNKFTRMGYGKSVGNVSFNNVEGTFTNVQRGLCGFIYAGEESLANLLNAFEKSGTKYDILPIWFSKKDVNNEQLRQENRKQSALINAQKRKEQIDKDKELARLREEADLAALKASGILKAEQQKELRKRYRNVIEAHLQKIEKETALLLDKDTNNTIKEHMALVGPMLSLYPSLLGFIEDRFKESWELDKFSIEINDYGLGNYRNRMIETFITDIDFTLKNRVLGEYDRSCARVAIIDDKEFDMLREPELKIYKGACKPGSLDSYKKKLDFQSSWIVE